MASTDQVGAYLQLLTIALNIGQAIYDDVKGIVADHAAANLTPQDYADLQDRWDADKLRAAANAGINPVTGDPTTN